MNNISFRELIDLEPKPKKVKYDGIYYEYDGEDYLVEDSRFLNENHKWVMKSFLENNMSFINMNKQLVEIIEEDKIINAVKDFQSFLLKSQKILDDATITLEDLQSVLKDKMKELGGK